MLPILIFPPPQEMLDSYRNQPFILHRRFISRDFADRLLQAAEGVPVREVICGDEKMRFGEQAFAAGHPIFHFFAQEDVISIAQLLLCTASVAEPLCWSSVYEEGQYIAAHKDGEGDIQFIVCLQAPPPASGGELCVDLPDGARKFSLAPGDAVFFRATELQHCTTPLLATGDDPCRRVVAVARYKRAPAGSTR